MGTRPLNAQIIWCCTDFVIVRTIKGELFDVFISTIQNVPMVCQHNCEKEAVQLWDDTTMTR